LPLAAALIEAAHLTFAHSEAEPLHFIDGIFDILRARRRPGFEPELEIVVRLDHRLHPTAAAPGSTISGHANLVHLQSCQTIDTFVHDRQITPAEELVGVRRIRKKVFTRALPCEVPRMSTIDSQQTFAAQSFRAEFATGVCRKARAANLRAIAMRARLGRGYPSHHPAQAKAKN
jgi:hypothetical protein